MTLEIWAVYTGTVLLFMSTPGPSHILMLSNSIQCGFSKSTATAAGDLSANFLQMIAASVGLVSLIQNSQQYFIFVKWAGVAYLAFLGVKLLISKTQHQEKGQSANRTARSLFWQGFITSAANPKAVIFFAALFPQFINPAAPLLSQFIILSASYLIIDGAFLCFYGKFADYFAKKLNSSLGQYFNKISGCLFLGAAVMLGLKDFSKK